MEEPHYRTPGEALAALLERYNQPPEALAEALGVPRTLVLQLIGDHIGISAETALRLGRATNTPPEYWLEMQNTADLNIARGRIGRSLSRIPSLVAAPPPPAPPQTARAARVFASPSKSPVQQASPMHQASDNVERLLQLAAGWAAGHPGYFRAEMSAPEIHQFTSILRDLAVLHIGRHEAKPLEIAGGREMIDYFFPEQRTAVEIVLDLPRTAAVFEHTVLKCLIAADEGARIERLLLLSRHGAAWTITERGPTGIAQWFQQRHGVSVEIRELGT